MKKALVVAHPDDEIIFFSSIIEIVDQIIICFGPSSSNIVTDGRRKLQARYPLKNIEWLNIEESNSGNSANWSNPKLTEFGIFVTQNRNKYIENFKYLTELFKAKLSHFDVVYTHNPWGEYGHEDHILVFKAVHSASKFTKTSVYVSSYLSDLSKKVFDTQKSLLGNEMIVASTPKNFCKSIEKLYIVNNCWTWDYDYTWPDTELFIKINDHSSLFKNESQGSTANPPIMILTRTFKQSPLRSLMSRLLPKTLKKYIKIFLKLHKK